MKAVAPAPLLLAEGLRFPEGPAFAPDGSLWFVELKGGTLARWQAGMIVRHPVGGAPNGAAIGAGGLIWFCDAEQNAIRRFDPRTGETTTLAAEWDGRPLNRPNDLAFDPAGNLVFTCPGNSRTEPSGSVHCLRGDGTVSEIAGDFYFPNGLAFTADGHRLIVAETYRQRLWCGGWDASRGEWQNPYVWADGLTGAPGPDGMAVSPNGSFVVAVYGAGHLKVLTPDGLPIGTIPTQGGNPTNCAFDPQGTLGLVVTEAEHGRLWSFPDACIPDGIRVQPHSLPPPPS